MQWKSMHYFLIMLPKGSWIYNAKNSGTSIEPCGTPWLTFIYDEHFIFTCISWHLSECNVESYLVLKLKACCLKLKVGMMHKSETLSLEVWLIWLHAVDKCYQIVITIVWLWICNYNYPMSLSPLLQQSNIIRCKARYFCDMKLLWACENDQWKDVLKRRAFQTTFPEVQQHRRSSNMTK